MNKNEQQKAGEERNPIEFIKKSYRYSRQYMTLNAYAQRIKLFALQDMRIGAATIGHMYNEIDVDKRVSPFSKSATRPVRQIFDDERTLVAAIRFYFDKKVYNRQRELYYFESLWAPYVDAYLETRPAPELFASMADKNGAVDMTQLIPMHQVMADGKLWWRLCVYFVQYVSRRMTAYMNSEHPDSNWKGRSSYKFWYQTKFIKIPVAQRRAGLEGYTGPDSRKK